MLLKLGSLTFEIPKPFPAIFFIIGQELFQSNTIAERIKSTWKNHHNEVDISSFSIQNANDWRTLEQEANSYCLFSNYTLIDSYYDKKTLDATGKAVLEHYLKQSNPNTLLLIRAPSLPVKQLQFLVNHAEVQVIFYQAPDKNTSLRWINERLQQLKVSYDPLIPALIHQYNEGNLFACSQVLDKLSLSTEPNQHLTEIDVKEQLVNQCDYPLFDLAESCLSGDSIKTLQLLRIAFGNKTEPTLVLWIITQEIRLLMQLLDPANQNLSFRDLASQLKIWSQRIRLYQTAIKKYQYNFLMTLLQACSKLDRQIKTSQNKQIWQSLELLALSLCLGKQAAYLG